MLAQNPTLIMPLGVPDAIHAGQPGFVHHAAGQHDCARACERGRRVSHQGGFSTKIHILVDRRGCPLCLRLTGGQRHDSTQAQGLVEAVDGGAPSRLPTGPTMATPSAPSWRNGYPGWHSRAYPASGHRDLPSHGTRRAPRLNAASAGPRVATRYDKYA